MALPPLAEVSDLAAWVGQSISTEDVRAGAVLSGASALVRSHTGETWLTDAGQLDEVPDLVSTVVVQVAARVWHNPASKTSFTIDDATSRWGDFGALGLYLTDSERAILSPFVVTQTSGLGTLSVTRGSLGVDTIYVPTAPEPSGPPFPWYASEDLS